MCLPLGDLHAPINAGVDRCSGPVHRSESDDIARAWMLDAQLPKLAALLVVLKLAAVLATLGDPCNVAL